MKNSSKKFVLVAVVFVAASFIANAQSNTPVSKTEQTATQQAAPEKFFNIQKLDDLKATTDAAYDKYKQASAEQKEALHFEYLKARRLYTVELEQQFAANDAGTPTGQKVRAEYRRVTTSE